VFGRTSDSGTAMIFVLKEAENNRVYSFFSISLLFVVLDRSEPFASQEDGSILVCLYPREILSSYSFTTRRRIPVPPSEKVNRVFPIFYSIGVSDGLYFFPQPLRIRTTRLNM